MSSSLPLIRTISARRQLLQQGPQSFQGSCRNGELTVLAEAVGPDDLLGLVEDVAHIDTDDELGTSLRGEHGQDTGTAPDLYSMSTRFGA